MNVNVESFTRALKQRLDEKPGEDASMTLTSDMAHDLYRYLVDSDMKEIRKERYGQPNVSEIADELRKCASEGTSPDPHTLVWAEYWLRYCLNKCTDPSHMIK